MQTSRNLAKIQHEVVVCDKRNRHCCGPRRLSSNGLLICNNIVWLWFWVDQVYRYSICTFYSRYYLYYISLCMNMRFLTDFWHYISLQQLVLVIEYGFILPNHKLIILSYKIKSVKFKTYLDILSTLFIQKNFTALVSKNYVN